MSNRVTIQGNLVADPELRYANNGTAVTQLAVADTPRRYNRDSGQWEDAGETLFLRGAVFGEKAELYASTFRKGQRVWAEGRLQARSYEKDGQKHTRTETIWDTIAAMPVRDVNKQGQNGQTGAAPYQGSTQPKNTPQNGGNSFGFNEPSSFTDNDPWATQDVAF